MQNQAVKNSDKTIVERRVAHEGDKSRAAVRDLRAGLNEQTKANKPTAKRFAADVLLRHAQSQPWALVAFLVFIAIGAFISQHLLTPLLIGIWLGFGVVIAGITLFSARRYDRLEIQTINLVKWERTFQFLTFLKGLALAGLLLLYPLFDSNGSFSIIVFSATTVITGLAFGSARYLKYGVLLAIAPTALAIVIRLLLFSSMPSITMAVLVIALLFFFQSLGKIIRAFHIEYLESKAERDQLIMELEAARAISEEARRRAEDANLAKSRFLATMSHELRTPLNAILGFSEIISNEVMGPLNNDHYKEYIGDIHRSGAHLLKLINEILDLSRVEAGRYELNEEATNLAHAAEESQQMVKLKASEKNITLVMQVQPDLPQIWADARAIRQVILNLLSNALKFTPSGGTVWLKVGWTGSGGQYISIKDTGPGIPEEEIPIVLSSFGQGSIAIKSAEQGTGLGLPIVQALVHMHEGKFELKSKLREGTEVIATFPHSRVMEVMPAMPVDGESIAKQRSARNFKDAGNKTDAVSMAG